MWTGENGGRRRNPQGYPIEGCYARQPDGRPAGGRTVADPVDKSEAGPLPEPRLGAASVRSFYGEVGEPLLESESPESVLD